MKPTFDWLANSRRARITRVPVSGSTACCRWPTSRARDRRASSRAVTALSAPIENLPTRPVSLAAPMMVAATGCFEYSSVVEVGRALRRAADAARVEQARCTAVVAVHVELERARAFDEERPPLLEERLERVEVDDGGVGFDLAEVGIGRRGQREARAHRVLQVEADRAGRIGALRRADCRSPGCSDEAAERCTAAARASSARPPSQAAHLGELRHEAVGVARQQRPRGGLGQPADFANHGEADRAAVGVVEAQLRERNAELGASSRRRRASTSTSHTASQLSSLGAVVEVIAIGLDADRVDAKLVGRSPIEVRIDDDAGSSRRASADRAASASRRCGRVGVVGADARRRARSSSKAMRASVRCDGACLRPARAARTR